MEDNTETTQELIVNARKRALNLVALLILLNFINLVFAACYLNCLGFTANYIPDLNVYWDSLLKSNTPFVTKELPVHAFLLGNLTLICYSFHQMNLLVLAWQLYFGGVIRRIKFECNLYYNIL